MKKYIIDSIIKFKNDLLAKGLYDILKSLIGLLIVIIALKWIPIINKIIERQFNVSIYLAITILFITISITALTSYLIYRKKIIKIIKDHQIDELTGLKNHKSLNSYLYFKLNEKKIKSVSISIIVIDIDNFKAFNTQYGHNTADQVLKKLGELLNNDKRVTDETFRFFHRGDEFVIVASDTNLGQAMQAAERKRLLIMKNFFSIGKEDFQVKVCCGVTEITVDDDFDSATNRAIEALNKAKKVPGKNNSKSFI